MICDRVITQGQKSQGMTQRDGEEQQKGALPSKALHLLPFITNFPAAQIYQGSETPHRISYHTFYISVCLDSTSLLRLLVKQVEVILPVLGGSSQIKSMIKQLREFNQKVTNLDFHE